MNKPKRFDRRYYDRYYTCPRSRVRTKRELGLHADFVCSYVKYVEQPVRRVLDLGCGLGEWQSHVARHFPSASYTGVEVSDYVCDRFGWLRGSVVDFRARAPYDLVICHDVLQYLPDADVTRAIRNLAALCRGVLSLNVPTSEDLDETVDRSRTDTDVYARPGVWYRRRLKKYFDSIGGGLLLPHDGGPVVFELQKTL